MTVTVQLDQEQAAALAELGRAQQRTIESLVSEAVAAHLASIKPTLTGWRNDPALAAAFGAWKGLVHEDGVEYQRRLRAEWRDPWDE